MTQIDLGNIRINWRGAYDSASNYVRHYAVSYQGSSFIAKVSHLNGPDVAVLGCFNPRAKSPPNEAVARSFNFKSISTKLYNSITVIRNVMQNIMYYNYKNTVMAFL